MTRIDKEEIIDRRAFSIATKFMDREKFAAELDKVKNDRHIGNQMRYDILERVAQYLEQFLAELDAMPAPHVDIRTGRADASGKAPLEDEKEGNP